MKLYNKIYAKLVIWKFFPPQLTHPPTNSNKTPSITNILLTNSGIALRASVRGAEKNIASDRKSRANSSCANASNVCSTQARRSSNSPRLRRGICMRKTRQVRHQDAHQPVQAITSRL